MFLFVFAEYKDVIDNSSYALEAFVRLIYAPLEFVLRLVDAKRQAKEPVSAVWRVKCGQH